MKLVGEKFGKKIFEDEATGIAWMHDGSSGMDISIHPSIDASGSIQGMKQSGRWKKEDIIRKANGYYFNISKTVCDSKEDMAVARHCNCETCTKKKGTGC